MEVPEQEIIYKVYFQGVSESNSEDISLTFFQHNNQEIILDAFPSFLLEYNEIARKKKVYSFGNIKEILPLGNATKANITQYYVLLFTLIQGMEKPKKSGLLIGKHKEKDFIILGIWPYEPSMKDVSDSEGYNQILRNIIEDPSHFRNVLLVN